MASNPKLDELNKLGLQYFDNWKDFAAAVANASPGQVIGGVNKKGKIVFHQGGIGEINIKQAKAELSSLKSASAPSQAPSGNIVNNVATGKKFDAKNFRLGPRVKYTPGLHEQAQMAAQGYTWNGTAWVKDVAAQTAASQPSAGAAAPSVQQNIPDPQQVNPSTKTIDDALKSPKSKSTKKDTTLKTGKKTPPSINRSEALIKLVNNPEAEQEMIDIVARSVGTRRGRSIFNNQVKSARGTLGKPDPGPRSSQGYIDAINSRDFFIDEGIYNRRNLLRQRIAEQNPGISKSKMRKLLGKEMSAFSDEAFFNIGVEANRKIVEDAYIENEIFYEQNRLLNMSPEQRLNVFQGAKQRTIRGKRVSINNISDRQVLDLSQRYLKQYERLEVGDSRIAGALTKAGERLRGGIAYGDLTYHPGYAAIEQSLDEASQRKIASKALGSTAAAIDDSSQVAGQISSALSAAGNMLDDSAQAITKVTSKKPISARTVQKLMSSHSLSAGVVAGGLGLLYGINRRRGEQQVG